MPQIRPKELKLDTNLDVHLDGLGAQIDGALSRLDGSSEKALNETLQDYEAYMDLSNAIEKIYDSLERDQDDEVVDISPAKTQLSSGIANGSRASMRIISGVLFIAFEKEENFWVYKGIFGRGGVYSFGVPTVQTLPTAEPRLDTINRKRQ